MGKYFSAKIANHYLYYTSFDKDEPIHAHASDRHLMEAGSAKIWVMKDGSTEVATRGTLTDRELRAICKFISKNHIAIFKKWEKMFGNIEFLNEPDKRYKVDETENSKIIELPRSNVFN